jgi:hypothetical protein
VETESFSASARASSIAGTTRSPKPIAAENLFLDVSSKDRRRAEIERVRGPLGACTPPAAFDFVENALRGRRTMTCERGTDSHDRHPGGDDAAESPVAARRSGTCRPVASRATPVSTPSPNRHASVSSRRCGPIFHASRLDALLLRT